MSSSPVSKDEIYARLPHSGAMRLLDAVLDWDGRSIRCSATSHKERANPLRREHGIAALHALEYAAQAIAVHGSLLSGHAAPRLVYVAAFRDVELMAGTLDRAADDTLDIVAEQHAVAAGGWSYGFRVTAAGTTVARGRATLADAGGVA